MQGCIGSDFLLASPLPQHTIPFLYLQWNAHVAESFLILLFQSQFPPLSLLFFFLFLFPKQSCNVLFISPTRQREGIAGHRMERNREQQLQQ